MSHQPDDSPAADEPWASLLIEWGNDGQAFLSYVRDDTEAETNALYQTLRSEFGEATIYKDVDNVPIGANWKESVRTAIEDSTAFLWVVGPAWTPSGGRPATHQLDRVGDISAFEAWTASSPTGPID